MAQDVGAEATEVDRLQRRVAELQEITNSQQAEIESLKRSEPAVASPCTPTDSALLWKACPSLACGIVRPHLVTLGDTVYVGGGNTRNLEMSRRVHKYVKGAEKWESLPITPYLTFALTVVKGYVTVVGGVNTISSLTCADLLHFDPDGNKWKKTYPPMPTKRCAASATAIQDHVIVAGGIHENGQFYLNCVEVLDTSTLQWSRAAPLPKATSFMCMTACEETGRIYMCGGLTKQGSIRSVFGCKLSDLIQSSASSEDSLQGQPGGKDGVWQDVASAPFHRMGCIALRGKLVIASGLNDEDRVTQSVFVLDPISREWKEVGKMAASRSSCSLASLGEGRVMVVGGYLNPRNWMTSLTTDVMECVNLQLN